MERPFSGSDIGQRRRYVDPASRNYRARGEEARYPSNMSASQDSSRDGDTQDLMRSKMAVLSQSSGRGRNQDELLNIIESNLGDVSKQLRQDIKADIRGDLPSSSKKSVSPKQPSLIDEFDFEVIRSLQEEFEAEFVQRFDLDNRAFVYLISQIDLTVLKYRVGSLCQLYKAIYTLQLERLEDIRSVQQALITFVIKGRFRECQYSLFVALELIYFIGGLDEEIELIQVLVDIVRSDLCDEVKRKAIRLLYNMSASSLGELIKLCEGKDEV